MVLCSFFKNALAHLDTHTEVFIEAVLCGLVREAFKLGVITETTQALVDSD